MPMLATVTASQFTACIFYVPEISVPSRAAGGGLLDQGQGCRGRAAAAGLLVDQGHDEAMCIGTASVSTVAEPGPSCCPSGGVQVRAPWCRVYTVCSRLEEHMVFHRPQGLPCAVVLALLYPLLLDSWGPHFLQGSPSE